MAKRVHIPFLLDILVVEDLSELQSVDRNADIERSLTPARGPLSRWLRQALERDLRFDGTLLPAFRARGDEERARRQEALEHALSALSTEPRIASEDLLAITDYLRGSGARDDAAVAVQQIVGRAFRPAYKASIETYRAAQRIEGWPRQPWRASFDRLTGRLRKAKQRLLDAADGDTACVHATGIAMHNIVVALENLRARYAEGEHAPLADADLAAPALVLRMVCRKTSLPFVGAPLEPGTLVIAPLARLHRADTSREFVFREHGWSRCPAHQFVPRLLTRAWTAALAT